MAVFRLALLEEAKSFLQSLPIQAYKKIFYNVDRVAGGEKNSELFKKLENSEIWELRTLFSGISYRLFALWDNETKAMVIVTHAMVKKTQKTPKKEIAKAERIRQEYYNEKNK